MMREYLCAVRRPITCPPPVCVEQRVYSLQPRAVSSTSFRPNKNWN